MAYTPMTLRQHCLRAAEVHCIWGHGMLIVYNEALTLTCTARRIASRNRSTMSQSRPSMVASPKHRAEAVEPRSFGHNLTAFPTPLVGREQEIANVVRMLRRPDVRLLTLVGPPGVGKTRLGVEAAANLVNDPSSAGSGQAFPDGVCLVPLAPIDEPDLVLPAITQALQLRGTADQSLLDALKSYLQDKQILLLLDNFEQVVAAGSQLADLLARCPGVKALVTSRELLRIYGEHDYPVPPLSLPDLAKLPHLETLSEYEAVALFLQRAQAVSPGFRLTERNARTVAEICLRLDGLPLAIELAAARVLALPPEELLARLKNRLRLLTGGARNLPPRQQTLRATIDWSYNLLDPREQALFRRLGVFVGGCALQAIEQVCSIGLDLDSLDGVTSLLGKSLLQRQDGVSGEARFMMLETIREYARDKLEEAGELDSIGDRHCDFFLQFAENAEQQMLGNEQLWMRRLDAELNNLRTALEWSLSREGQAENGIRLAGALSGYWDQRGYFSEGRQWYTRLLSKTEQAQPSVERARALRALARLSYQQGDFPEAREMYERSLEISRALGDDSGIAGAMLGLGNLAMWEGDYEFSRSCYEECLAIGRKLGDMLVIARALSMTGVILMRKGEYHAAQSPLDEALAITRELGDRGGLALTLGMRGTVAFHLGEFEEAKALIEEGLRIARELDVGYAIAFCLARLGMIALRQGDPRQAEAALLEGLDRVRDSGIRRWSRWYLVGLAEVARLRGMSGLAAKLIGASEGVASAARAHYEPATSDEIERITRCVRATLDEETFARLSAEGRALSLEQAIAFAAESSSEDRSQAEATSDSGQVSTTRGHESPYPDDLTEREVEVLRLIAVGKSNQEIGQELVLSRRTVERHISNIYLKIGATGKVARAAATAYALRHGLVT